MTLSVMIADDEAPARRKLSRFLGEHADIEIVAEASNGVDALDFIAAHAPDVAFLDIHMPDLDGFSVAESLARSGRAPQIVFVTAYDSYAVKAFEVRALDYLLKPYDRPRFEQALEHARRALAANPAANDLAGLLARVRNESRYLQRLLVPHNGRSFFVDVREIVRLESDGNNVNVHTSRGCFPMRSTLESFAERLDPSQFARIHRAHIVNIGAIAEIVPWFHGDMKATMRDGSELPWSRRYAAKRRDLLP